MQASKTVCLITGASGGIGSAIARALDEKDARLYLVGRNLTTLKELERSLRGEHQCLQADLTSDSGRQELMAAVANDEALNTVIQAAGVSSFAPLPDQSPAMIEASVYVNLTVPVLLSRQLVPVLLGRRSPTIMFIGSAFGSIGYPGFSSYCAAKFGLRGFAEALRRELGDALRVHYLAPRATRTDFNSAAVSAMNEQLGNSMDSPETVADAVLTMLQHPHSQRKTIGWPEKLFCRLNGALPEIVDKALGKKSQQILHFAHENTLKGETR